MMAKDNPSAIHGWKYEFVFVHSWMGWDLPNWNKYPRPKKARPEEGDEVKVVEDYFKYVTMPLPNKPKFLHRMPCRWLPENRFFTLESFLCACGLSRAMDQFRALNKLPKELKGNLTPEEEKVLRDQEIVEENAKQAEQNLAELNIKGEKAKGEKIMTQGSSKLALKKKKKLVLAPPLAIELREEGKGQAQAFGPPTSPVVFKKRKKVYGKNGEAFGWGQTKINIDEHIIIPNLDQNINSPDQFVEDYASNMTKTTMDSSKPLWELHILHIKTSKANSVVIFRIHHSLGDGVSLISLLLACTRKSSDPEALPSLPINNKKKNMKQFDQTSTSSWLSTCFQRSLLFFKFSWNTMVDLALFTATSMYLKDTNTPLKGPLGTEQNPRRFVHRTFSLDDVKLVKNAMKNMTINDVVLGITQAGLSCYLNRKYGKIKEDENSEENDLSKHMIRLRAALLVNLRSTNTVEGLAELMEKETSSKRQWNWGNSIGYVLFPFHIGLRDDPLDYIRDSKATIDRKKQSLEAPYTGAMAKISIKTLGLKFSGSVTHRVLSNTTMCFSNVVGPMDEISFYGHPIAYFAPSVYGHPHALIVHFQSYMDTMTCVLSVDPNVIPDAHKLCDDIVDSLQLAKNAVIQI